MSDQTTTGPVTGEDLGRSVHSPGLPRFKDQRAVYVGIAVWAALLVVGLAEHDRLVAGGNGWWIWTPVAGIVLGFIAYGYIRGRAVLDQRRDDDPKP